jgi:hypothetical protein
MQHKKQLGGNKIISKARVFKPDVGSLPYMLFYVDGPALAASFTEQANGTEDLRERLERRIDRGRWSGIVEAHVLEQSKDGKSILREHVIHLRS